MKANKGEVNYQQLKRGQGRLHHVTISPESEMVCVLPDSSNVKYLSWHFKGWETLSWKYVS